MFEMIRLIFCRMPLQNSVMLKLKNYKSYQTFPSSLVRKIYNIQIQIFLKYHLQKCTLLSLQELKSQDIVSISTLSALILAGEDLANEINFSPRWLRVLSALLLLLIHCLTVAPIICGSLSCQAVLLVADPEEVQRVRSNPPPRPLSLNILWK